MAGPGKIWAFTISAHFAIDNGPEVYCFWTVPVAKLVLVLDPWADLLLKAYVRVTQIRSKSKDRTRTANVTELSVLKD